MTLVFLHADQTFLGISPDAWAQVVGALIGIISAAVIALLVSRRDANQTRVVRYADTVQPILDEVVAEGARAVHSLFDLLVTVAAAIDTETVSDNYHKFEAQMAESNDRIWSVLVLAQRWSAFGIHGEKQQQIAGEVLGAMHDFWNAAREHRGNVALSLSAYLQVRISPADWRDTHPRLRLEGRAASSLYDRMRDHIHLFVATLGDRQPPSGQPTSLASIADDEQQVATDAEPTTEELDDMEEHIEYRVEYTDDDSDPDASGFWVSPTIEGARRHAERMNAKRATIQRTVSRVDAPAGTVRMWGVGPNGEYWKHVSADDIEALEDGQWVELDTSG